MPHLILFDIDGTLVKGNKAHLEAFNYVFREIFGVKDADIEEIEHHGLTDELIIRIIMKRHGIRPKEIDEKINEVKTNMIKYYQLKLPEFPVSIVPGTRTFLEEIKEEAVLGLITGNLKDIARIKLNSVDLWDYFSVGGFGSENTERFRLIEYAIKRAVKLKDVKFNKNEIIIFGDTPRDIGAAKKLNLNVIGIASGKYSENALKDAGAKYVYRDFSEISRIREDLSI
ncbi:MAG: HAD hydrolase-like protein [Candidatus Lokiarchaeota archaeon]|nr:HAD hydrolase-like protein [Candidatus Lokiarchaeota archaeon]